MRRATPAIAVAVLVVAALVGVPAATMAQETATETNEPASVAPGAQFAGAVGVQGAELGGDVEARAYGISVARANSDAARASVVAGQAGAVERRLDRLEQRKTDLDQARANGSMSDGEYRARVAQPHAQTRATSRLANQTATTADRLPAQTLRENGVDVEALRMLVERSVEMTGPEVAEIARQIAGPRAGDPPRPDRAQAGPMAGDAGPRTDRGPNAADDRGPRMGDTANQPDGSETAANRTTTTDGT
ncbi:hypothetical protein ACFQH8_04045 [Halomicroarcula sp. GCM10025710]